MKESYTKIGKIILLVQMLLLLSNCSSQTLIFRPYGIIDKPLPHIEIREIKNDLKKEFDLGKDGLKTTYIFYVETSTFKLIQDAVVNYDSKIKYNSNTNYEFGTYKILLKDSSQTLEYMLLANKNSFNLFKQILPLTKSNNRLQEEITLLLNRLD